MPTTHSSMILYCFGWQKANYLFWVYIPKSLRNHRSISHALFSDCNIRTFLFCFLQTTSSLTNKKSPTNPSGLVRLHIVFRQPYKSGPSGPTPVFSLIGAIRADIGDVCCLLRELDCLVFENIFSSFWLTAFVWNLSLSQSIQHYTGMSSGFLHFSQKSLQNLLGRIRGGFFPS